MTADETGPIGSPSSRATQALGAAALGAARVVRASNTMTLARFWKYAVLICAVAVTLKVVFDAYSFYVARREIDSELSSKKVSSLEYLGILSQRERALAITALEGRCLERTQLTLFRLFDAQQDRIKAVYDQLITVKNKMVDLVNASGQGLIDVAKAADFIDYQRFSLAGLDDYIKPINPETANNPDYQALRAKLLVLRDQYGAIALANEPLRAELEKIMRDKKLDGSPYWNMDAIQRVAQRNAQVRKELEEVKDKVGDIEDVLARYAVWTGALTGGAANNPVLDETAYEIEKADASALNQPNCAAFKDYYAAVNNRILQLDPLAGGAAWSDLSWAQRWRSILHVYDQFLLSYFNQPPAAQTLFVTMFLGALGALTLNILRLSKVGWWSLQEDPAWGEIVVGPLLGALAAFGIFLIGSSGLLLTSGAGGGQALSAYFIGLLGFISGLLYDEAFGRVRRVGSQIFSQSGDDGLANARAEDRSLAEKLRGNSASLAADLVIKYGVGTRLGLEKEFTLLMPSDEAMGQLPLATWNELNDREHGLFEKWYHHHHSEKRIARADMAGDGSPPKVVEMQVDDGTSYAVMLEGGDIKINGARILIADIAWNNGIIHVLAAELA